MEAQPGNAPGVALGHFEAPAGRVLEDLARLRHVAGEDRREASESVDILFHGAEPSVDGLGDLLKLGPGIGVPDALVDRDQHAGRFLVMLVLDFAYDLLDHVLDGNEPLGAAEL